MKLLDIQPVSISLTWFVVRILTLEALTGDQPGHAGYDNGKALRKATVFLRGACQEHGSFW